ncbi:MAG: twin-arginine translocase subunit TatB [Alphaproteobacteria bacterium]|nr:twin-arginine translocase subunit TatB [Alphaproteobacteria bacterium]
MFDVGFTELLLIAVVTLIFVGPKDLPKVARYIISFVRELKGVAAKVRAQVDEVVEQSGANEIKMATRTIIDLEGKPQIAYDLEELKSDVIKH